MAFVTEDMIKQLRTLMEQIDEPLKITFKNMHQGYPTEILMRFLKAREGDVSKAHKMLLDCLNWRIQNEIDAILGKPIVPTEFYRAVRDSQLIGMSGYSKEGLPVIAIGAGLSTFDKASIHYYVQSHIQMNEYRDRVLFPSATKKFGRHISTCVKVLDMTGLKLSALNQIKLLSVISTIDDLNYPEKTTAYYIVNAPYVFSACWKVVRPLLQERTRNKVQVLPGSGKDELLKIMDYASLPHFCKREGSGSSFHSRNKTTDNCFSLDHAFHQQLYNYIKQQAQLMVAPIRHGSVHVDFPEPDPEDGNIAETIESACKTMGNQIGLSNSLRELKINDMVRSAPSREHFKLLKFVKLRTERRTERARAILLRIIRYGNDLPRIDIFVCTANPEIEPPIMVTNTVLSVMAYDYPPEKIAVYLSDDGGSDLTFYALLEASRFSQHWLPFCKKFNVEPRSPAAYFSIGSWDAIEDKELASVKKLYEEMENRITTAVKLRRIPGNTDLNHKGFSQWNSFSSQRDHDTILQLIIDGRDPNAKDIEGCALPTLVYLAREKRPQYPHNFKAGAMNALIRVSSEISNGQVILNVDCDMYSNNSCSVRDVLCFFMDEEKGHEIAFVQFPQNFENLTKNEVYSGSLRVLSEVEFHGFDGYEGPLYVGTGCFHRRDTLCGREFSKESRIQWRSENDKHTKESADELETRVKGLASCAYEDNTQWGKEMGLRYGCPVEDVMTGLSIQCLGWKSVYYNPARKGFLGVAATSLDQTLLQHKRWSEGDLQVLLSRYSPAWYGLGRISPGLLLGYCSYCLWAPNSLATVFYSTAPSLYLLRGISLFPQVSLVN